jgi:hypothetical protein
MLHALPGPSGRLGGWVGKRIFAMKMFRNLLLAVIAFTVVAGSVVPANAAMRHHHRARHHHKK